MNTSKPKSSIKTKGGMNISIKYVKFSIVDVARDCGIHMKDPNRTEIRCRCPFCDNGRGRLTASINRDKGVFFCFRCGEGLNSISLYAKISGTDNDVAYRELLGRVA